MKKGKAAMDIAGLAVVGLLLYLAVSGGKLPFLHAVYAPVKDRPLGTCFSFDGAVWKISGGFDSSTQTVPATLVRFAGQSRDYSAWVPGKTEKFSGYTTDLFPVVECELPATTTTTTTTPGGTVTVPVIPSSPQPLPVIVSPLPGGGADSTAMLVLVALGLVVVYFVTKRK